jgi:hypothetical protein
VLNTETYHVPEKAKTFVRGTRKANGSSEETAGLPKETPSTCPAFCFLRDSTLRVSEIACVLDANSNYGFRSDTEQGWGYGKLQEYGPDPVWVAIITHLFLPA